MRASLFSLARAAAPPSAAAAATTSSAVRNAASKPRTKSAPPSSSKPDKVSSKSNNAASNKPSSPKRSRGGVMGENHPLLRPYPLSPSLSHFLGVNRSSRGDTMKKIWAHIRENKLQSSDIKTTVISDEKLKALLGRERFTITELPKLLAPHFVKE